MPAWWTILSDMSQDHTLMASRYELKYVIRNDLALRIRDFISQHLELDEFGVGMPNLSYPIHSLYMDSDDWKIYWRTLNGDKNRFKLRVRYYNESNKTPVFWEIKRRMKDVILKQRCGIKRPYAQAVLNGHLPERSWMVAPDDESEVKAIQEFFRLQFDVGAKGKMDVAYDREAYVSADNNEFRVTFDRNIRVGTRFDQALTTRMEKPFVCTGPGTRPNDVVVLELKFTTRFPNFYRDMVRSFNLTQTGAAKYNEGTTLYAGRDLEAKDIIHNMVL
jgi:hypothetical protein